MGVLVRVARPCVLVRAFLQSDRVGQNVSESPRPSKIGGGVLAEEARISNGRGSWIVVLGSIDKFQQVT